MQSSLARRAASESIGTFALVFVAAGAAMTDEISGGGLGILGNALASGLVVTGMIYAVGHISGAHINPAVTLGFTIIRRLPLRDAAAYWAAQTAGAALAAGALRLLIGNVGVMGGNSPTIDPAQALALEAVLTFLLMFVIMAVATDKRAVGHAAAIAVGATVAFDIMVGGPLSGGSMNPARSFGPALVAANWQDHWIYWLGPSIGAAAAAILYSWLNDAETPKQELENPPAKKTRRRPRRWRKEEKTIDPKP